MSTTTASLPVADKAALLNALLGNWYNVINYGADPTGVSDSTAAIQSALDAAFSAGAGTVYLPKGVYRTTAILLAKSKVRVQGAGMGVTIIRPDNVITGDNSAYAVLGARGATNVEFYDLTVDQATNSNANNGIALFPTVTAGDAMSGPPCVDCIIQRCEVLQYDNHIGGGTSTGYGIWNRRARGTHILDCRVDGGNSSNFTASTQEGIEIFGGENVLVSGNTVKNIGNNGIFVQSTADSPETGSRRIRIINNDVRGCASGIQLTFLTYGSSTFTALNSGGDLLLTLSGVHVSDNQVVQVSSSGALPTGVSASTDYYVVEQSGATCKLATTKGGTPITYTDSGTGTHTMHRLQRIDGCTVHGNTLTDNYETGITAYQGVNPSNATDLAGRNIKISDNIVTTNNALSGASQISGILWDKQQVNGVLRGCEITGNSVSGGKGGSGRGSCIHLNRFNGGLVKDNNCNGDSQSGTSSYSLVNFVNSSNWQFTGNTLHACYRSGLYITACTEYLVQSNNIYDTDIQAGGHNAISLLQSGTYGVFRDNLFSPRGNTNSIGNGDGSQASQTYMSFYDNTVSKNQTNVPFNNAVDTATCNFGTATIPATSSSVTVTNNLVRNYDSSGEGSQIVVHCVSPGTTTDTPTFYVTQADGSFTITRTGTTTGAATYRWQIR